MKRLLFLFCCILIISQINAQNEIIPNGYNKFFHENGIVSSEGSMINGKPDGYWKTYNEVGMLISEGNRKNFLLDSLWKFYNKSGNLILEINYKNNKKNGIRRTYRKKEIIEENFVDDIKNGATNYFFQNGKLKRTVNFMDGLESGISKEYANDDGRVIILTTYKKGFVVEIERINKFDNNKLKQGNWKYFHKNGNLKLEGKYKNDLKNGYFKTYSEDGNLKSTEKYIDGVLQIDVVELVKLDVKTDYYDNGNVKVVATYKDDLPEGIRREYSEEGEIVSSYIFKHGIIIGKGIITEKGEKDSYWREFYDQGNLKAEGNYKNDIKTGEWKYYHKNGNLEQIGLFDDDGKPEGLWKWYYDSGEILREENFYRGLSDGLLTEYDEDGGIITKGEFIEGYEEGPWIYEMGDHREEGSYSDGYKSGIWKYFYNDGTLSFEGEFIDDLPNGKHTFYWDNGNIKDIGNYVMGIKEGDWKKNDYDGNMLIIIRFRNGIEKRYDGIKINTEEEEEIEDY